MEKYYDSRKVVITMTTTGMLVFIISLLINKLGYSETLCTALNLIGFIMYGIAIFCILFDDAG